MHRRILIALLLLGARVAVAQPAPPAPAAHDGATPPGATPELRALVADARRAGLPAELLVAKAREGAAKNVPPARILVVVRGLGAALLMARGEAQPFVGAAASPALLRALVEAHAAGVSVVETLAVMRAHGRERALFVLAELVQRGWPAPAAARAIVSLADRARALDELADLAERRGHDGATPPALLEALSHIDAHALPSDHAEQNLRSAIDVADDDGRGPNRETSGARGPRSGGVAPPARGHL